MNILKLKRSPGIFHRLFGISPAKFDELVEKLRPLWADAELERKASRPRKAKIGGGRPYRLSLEESCAMLLLYVRSYSTHVFLAALFDIHDSMVCRYFARLRPVAANVFDLSSAEKDLREKEVLELIVDATEQRTERRKEGCGYSGKKKAHTIKTQVVVDGNGGIVHVSGPSPGNVHDKRLFDGSGVLLPGNALGDLGYLGVPISLPAKSSKLRPLTDGQKKENKRHAERRIIVEHVFASLKKYRILSDRFRGPLGGYGQYFSIVCGLREFARA